MSKVIFIDVETSGYDRSNHLDRSGNYKYQIVSIGAVVSNTVDWRSGPTFYTEIKWNGTSKWDKEAEAVHGLSKDYLEEHGLSEEQALAAFCEFLANNINVEKAITLGGHNVPTFDRHFLIQLFDKYELQIKLSGHCIDSFTLGSILFDVKDSNELFEMFGIIRSQHNSLEDAQAALKCVRMIKKIYNESTAG